MITNQKKVILFTYLRIKKVCEWLADFFYFTKIYFKLNPETS